MYISASKQPESLKVVDVVVDFADGQIKGGHIEDLGFTNNWNPVAACLASLDLQGSR